LIAGWTGTAFHVADKEALPLIASVSTVSLLARWRLCLPSNSRTRTASVPSGSAW
jgi:hypothetical protein